MINRQHLCTWLRATGEGPLTSLCEVRLNLVHVAIGLKMKHSEGFWDAGGLEQKVEALAAAMRMRAGAGGGAQAADSLAGLDPASLERVRALRIKHAKDMRYEFTGSHW